MVGHTGIIVNFRVHRFFLQEVFNIGNGFGFDGIGKYVTGSGLQVIFLVFRFLLQQKKVHFQCCGVVVVFKSFGGCIRVGLVGHGLLRKGSAGENKEQKNE